MTDKDPPPCDAEKLKATKEFLLAEHTLFKEFFLNDLDVSGKRVDFFTKIAGGSIAFIGTLMGLGATDIFGTFIDYTGLLLLGSFITPALLVIGYSILVRIAYMKISIEKWKKRMAMITIEFRKISCLSNEYTPFDAQRPEYLVSDVTQKWDRGDHHVIMQRINAIILVTFFELLMELFRPSFSFLGMGWYFFPIAGGVLVYIVVVELQRAVIDRKTKSWICEVSNYIARIEGKPKPCEKKKKKTSD